MNTVLSLRLLINAGNFFLSWATTQQRASAWRQFCMATDSTACQSTKYFSSTAWQRSALWTPQVTAGWRAYIMHSLITGMLIKTCVVDNWKGDVTRLVVWWELYRISECICLLVGISTVYSSVTEWNDVTATHARHICKTSSTWSQSVTEVHNNKQQIE